MLMLLCVKLHYEQKKKERPYQPGDDIFLIISENDEEKFEIKKKANVRNEEKKIKKKRR